MSKKRDISQLQFRSIAGWRGDSLCCPQAFGGDIFSGCSTGCWWCFCREMEEELYNKYYEGWSRDLVRPCNPDDYRKLFDRAFGSDKEFSDWNVKCLRYGLPFNMGSKAETFCVEDRQDKVVVPVLELFKEYKVPIIFETKSHYIGMRHYLDIVKELNCAVIVAIMGGSDTLNYKLEPGAPTASARWYLVEQLNKLGIWTGVRWEPILAGINSSDEVFESYIKQAVKSGAKHISFYNYRTSNSNIALREFLAHGYSKKEYGKLLMANLDKDYYRKGYIGKVEKVKETWPSVGRRFLNIAHRYPIKVSTPDFVNFPFDSDCESCCGVDSKFKSYQFTFQHACQLIKQKGQVSWQDMEEVEFRELEAYERAKQGWNGKGQYYTLRDSSHIVVMGKDKDGMNIYGGGGGRGKEGFGFI